MRYFNPLRSSDACMRQETMINYEVVGADNGLMPIQCQAIMWTKDGLLSNGPQGYNSDYNQKI